MIPSLYIQREAVVGHFVSTLPCPAFQFGVRRRAFVGNVRGVDLGSDQTGGKSGGLVCVHMAAAGRIGAVRLVAGSDIDSVWKAFDHCPGTLGEQRRIAGIKKCSISFFYSISFFFFEFSNATSTNFSTHCNCDMQRKIIIFSLTMYGGRY